MTSKWSLLLVMFGVIPAMSSAAPLDVAAFMKGRGFTDTKILTPSRMPVLATSKFAKGDKTYYMTMFRGLTQKRMAIVSISKTNVITPEKELAALASAKAPMTDMRSVRMLLLPHLK